MSYDQNAYRDGNFVTTLIGVSSTDGVTPTRVAVDPVTGRVLVDLPSGSGLTFQAATGTVNGSNTSFTFVTAPKIIFVDGVSKQKTASDGTVNWTGTTSVTLSVAPTFDVFAIG